MELRNKDIEASIIISFLDNEIGLNEPFFKIESKYFENFFNKMVVDRINKAIENNESLSLLDIQLEEWVATKQQSYQMLYLDIVSQTPLPMNLAKKYYNKLKMDFIKKEVGK